MNLGYFNTKQNKSDIFSIKASVSLSSVSKTKPLRFSINYFPPQSLTCCSVLLPPFFPRAHCLLQRSTRGRERRRKRKKLILFLTQNPLLCKCFLLLFLFPPPPPFLSTHTSWDPKSCTKWLMWLLKPKEPNGCTVLPPRVWQRGQGEKKTPSLGI